MQQEPPPNRSRCRFSVLTAPSPPAAPPRRILSGTFLERWNFQNLQGPDRRPKSRSHANIRTVADAPSAWTVLIWGGASSASCASCRGGSVAVHNICFECGANMITVTTAAGAQVHDHSHRRG
jgi:hypothetical protein